MKSDDYREASFKDIQFQAGWYQDQDSSQHAGLNLLRYETIPEVVARRRADGDAFLEKTELGVLMEWKLKRSRYQPQIAEKVAHLSLDDVRGSTRAAYKIYAENPADLKKATSTLTKLNAITLPTATLIMSVFDPIEVPFFCDDLYRYLHIPEREAGTFDGKVHYTQKEFTSLFNRVLEVRNRIQEEENKKVTALDLEKFVHVTANLQKSTKECGGVLSDGPEKSVLPPSPKPRASKRQKPAVDRDPHFDPLYKCFEKGPNGSPTLDHAGFELDYDKVAKWMKPMARRKPNWKKFDAMIEREKHETERKSVLMDGQGKDQPYIEQAWDDRVRKDLGKQHFSLNMDDYENWYQQGFRAKPGEFDNPTQEEMNRRIRLAEGGALRK